ncbi:hypothetical protein AC578_5302 [Pseudocercospora eumusae]|uniref:Uncharacterized protein n=1 Tax=Pseudocercospora eumusae TaxID=321146 RepID=A0A139GZV1_9PEZI|nr:hypothetical protein AC578_5302 [Pseudocercospora eumusae]
MPPLQSENPPVQKPHTSIDIRKVKKKESSMKTTGLGNASVTPRHSLPYHRTNESSIKHVFQFQPRGTIKAETVVQASSEAMELDKIPAAIKDRDSRDMRTRRYRDSEVQKQYEERGLMIDAIDYSRIYFS